MNDEAYDLKRRTKRWAQAIIRLYSTLPRTAEAQVIGKQALRSGTSVGAHYREATRARSNAEFVSKIECGLQELEETRYWLELMVESGNGATVGSGDHKVVFGVAANHRGTSDRQASLAQWDFSGRALPGGHSSAVECRVRQ